MYIKVILNAFIDMYRHVENGSPNFERDARFDIGAVEKSKNPQLKANAQSTSPVLKSKTNSLKKSGRGQSDWDVVCSLCRYSLRCKSRTILYHPEW